MDNPSTKPKVDFSSQAACEAAKVGGVLAGYGLLPLLPDRFAQHLWIACLLGGVLAVAAGLLRAWRFRPARLVPSGWAYFTLQFQTVLVGALLLFSALAAFALRHLAGLEPGLFQLYLSTPTILAWTSGEMQFARPLIGTRPKHSAEITGMFAHGLQILGALVLWIFLGLSVGTDSLAWMGWTAAGLSVVGMLVALSTNAPAPSTQGAGPRAKTWQQLRQIEKTGPS